MTDFSIIIHPVNLDLIYYFDPDARRKRVSLLKKVLEWMPPFYASKIENVKSITGKEVEGNFIMCPLLPDQIINSKPQIVLKKIIDAGKIAEDLGSKILGLAAYVSLVGRKGVLISRSLKIPVTTGTCYTIGTALDGLIEAAKRVGLNLKNAQAVVIGATGTIGSICSQFLLDKVGSLTLIARNKERLSELNSMLNSKNKNHIRIEVSDDINKSLKNAHIIFSATNSPLNLIDILYLSPGAIVFDMSQPRNICEDNAIKRKDVLVIDGGVVLPPGNVKFNFNFGLAPGLAFACIAETMILALEDRYESFSLGGNATLSKVQEISCLAKKHGFALSELRSFSKEITEEQIFNIRNIVTKRN